MYAFLKNEQFNNYDFQIYPNIISKNYGTLNISSNYHGEIDIEIFSLEGLLIQKHINQKSNISLYLKNVNRGYYYAVIHYDSKKITNKILIE